MTENHGGGTEHTSAGDLEACVWTFVKGGEVLTIEQRVERGRMVEILTRAGKSGAETGRAYEFHDSGAAAQFHANLEATLLWFHWSCVAQPRRGATDSGKGYRYATGGVGFPYMGGTIRKHIGYLFRNLKPIVASHGLIRIVSARGRQAENGTINAR